MKQFLQGIELIEEDKPAKTNKLTTFEQAALQFSIDFEEEKAQSDWSTLYQALENLEKLFSSATVGA
jgi:hypothetical protein